MLKVIQLGPFITRAQNLAHKITKMVPIFILRITPLHTTMRMEVQTIVLFLDFTTVIMFLDLVKPQAFYMLLITLYTVIKPMI